MRAAEEMEEQHVLRFEDGVALQLAAPVAIGVLQRAQTTVSRVDSGCEPRRFFGSFVEDREIVNSHLATSPTSGPKAVEFLKHSPVSGII